jgi:hypothetical protein
MIKEFNQRRRLGRLAALVVLKAPGEVFAVWAVRNKLT